MDAVTIKRFWSRVDRREDTSCWAWLGSKTRSGYGMFKYTNDGEKTTTTAHRFSYRLSCGKIRRGFLICHKCDNPSCVNPSHLYEGTASENYDDIRKKKGMIKGGNFVNFPLLFDTSFHTRLRLRAKREGISIKELIFRAIGRELEKNGEAKRVEVKR